MAIKIQHHSTVLNTVFFKLAKRPCDGTVKKMLAVKEKKKSPCGYWVNMCGPNSFLLCPLLRGGA